MEEELSLRECIETILKGSKIIAVITICCLIAAFAGTYYLQEKNAQARIVISFNHKGIENGINPDGTRFDADSSVKSPAVIVNVLEELDQKRHLSVDDIRRNIHIEPITPNYIIEKIKMLREEGEDFKYYPNEFIVSINTDPSAGIDKRSAKEILDKLIDTYIIHFNDEYSDGKIVANAIGQLDYQQYDYHEISKVIDNQLQIFQSYLSGKIAEAQDFRANATGLTFNDIKKSVDIIGNIDLNKVDSIIGAFNLTKDKEKLIINYEYAIKQNELEKQKKESELAIAKEMMSDFNEEKSMLLIPGVTEQGVEVGQTDSYYDKLVERATNAGVDATSKGHDIVYIHNEIEKLQNDQISTALKQQAEREVLVLVEQIKGKLQHWIEMTNLTAEEYDGEKLSKAVMRVSPVEIYKQENLKLNLAVAGLLGIMLGVFVVFFKEYWKNSSAANREEIYIDSVVDYNARSSR